MENAERIGAMALALNPELGLQNEAGDWQCQICGNYRPEDEVIPYSTSDAHPMLPNRAVRFCKDGCESLAIAAAGVLEAPSDLTMSFDDEIEIYDQGRALGCALIGKE